MQIKLNFENEFPIGKAKNGMFSIKSMFNLIISTFILCLLFSISFSWFPILPIKRRSEPAVLETSRETLVPAIFFFFCSFFLSYLIYFIIAPV